MSDCKVSFRSPTIVATDLHGTLLISQCDAHLLKRRFIERAGHLQTFRLLVLLQAGASGGVEFARLFAAIKTPLLQHRLSLLDLIRTRPEDRAAVRIAIPCGLVGVLIRVRVRILRYRDREHEQEGKYDPRESLRLFSPA